MLKNINDLTLQSIDNNIVVIRNRVNVESIQKYKNNYNETVNINYQFPIPSKAAVYCFELLIDNQKYEAKIEEKTAAIETFQDASQQGDTAAIITKHDNAFTFIISNIEKGKEFEIKLKYIYDIKASNNKYRLQIPTTLAPKYEGERLTYIISDKEEATHKTNFNIKLFGVSEIKAESDHDIELINEDEYINVKALNIIPNRDFVLSLKIDENSYILEASNNEEKYSYLNLEIPEAEDEERQESLKYMFIMDRSGSMGGQKFEKAKNMLKLCLRNLEETDLFNIMFFENHFEKYKNDYVFCNEGQLTNADLFIDNMQTRGGTDIYNALKDCIYEDNLTILLFTDGQVWNTEQVYELIKNKGKNTKLFCFGIDDAIDEDFITKMAELGDGRSEFLNSSEDFYEKTIHQIISTFYKQEKLHIDLSDEELLLTIYPGDSISMIKKAYIKNVKNFENIARIKDDTLFNALRLYYYYDICNNKRLDYELLLKYSKESNILTEQTTFILVKENEDKTFASKNIEITGMIPTGWNTNPNGYSNEYMSYLRDSISCCCVNSVSATNSFDPTPRRKTQNLEMKKSFMPNILNKQSEALRKENNTRITYSMSRPPVNETEEERERRLDEQELFELFLDQRADGSINGYIDKTMRAVELYKKLGEPKMYKVQYKKALKFLKKKNIKM